MISIYVKFLLFLSKEAKVGGGRFSTYGINIPSLWEYRNCLLQPHLIHKGHIHILNTFKFTKS